MGLNFRRSPNGPAVLRAQVYIQSTSFFRCVFLSFVGHLDVLCRGHCALAPDSVFSTRGNCRKVCLLTARLGSCPSRKGLRVSLDGNKQYILEPLGKAHSLFVYTRNRTLPNFTGRRFLSVEISPRGPTPSPLLPRVNELRHFRASGTRPSITPVSSSRCGDEAGFVPILNCLGDEMN